MSRILVDLMPGGGSHGVRGIGRYVRGLASAIAGDDQLRREVVGLVGSDADVASHLATAVSAVPQGVIEWRSHDLGWLTGWLTDSVTVRRVRPAAYHHTDPRKPMRPLGVQRVGVTAYDLTPLEPIYWNALRRHRRLLYRRYLRLLAGADTVLAISRATAERLTLRLGIDPARIDVVYPVVFAAPEVVREIGSGEPTFLVVGVLDPHKTPELAVAALAQFRAQHGEGRLRILGAATPKTRRRLAAEVRRHGVEEAVSIEGYVPEAELESAYRSAHALMAVSALEGFGLPSVEAAVRGVPVVAVDIPVAREALQHGATFAEADPGKLADAMAAATPPSDGVRKALRQRYSADSAARALRRAYARLLETDELVTRS